MTPELLYIIKVTGAFTVFYLCYRFFLSSDTFFNRNRFYLIGSMVISIFAPLLKITIKTLEIKNPPIIELPGNFEAIPIETQVVTPIWPIILKYLVVLYAIVSIFLLIRLIIAYITTSQIIIHSERSKFYNYILALTYRSVSPFSILKWLVIPKNKENHPDFNNIVQHESIHSRQYHSVDLFLAEIMIVFQWFNPFVWMMKKAIIENHEYIVDKTLLKMGINAQQYQYSLLNIVADQGGQLAVANHFNSNLLKKRIRMMNKNQSPRWHRIKNVIILLVVTLVVFTTVSFETKVIAQTQGNDPLVIINGKKASIKDLTNINPNSIEKVEVFKDTIATRDYGYIAKNGVIKVTVKDSLQNEKIIITEFETQLGSEKDTLENKYLKSNLKHFILINDKEAEISKKIIKIDGKVKIKEISDNPIEFEEITVDKLDKAVEKFKKSGDENILVKVTIKDSKDSINSIKKVYTKVNEITYIIDGNTSSVEELNKVLPDQIAKINVINGLDTIGKYGTDKVIEITTKSKIPNNQTNSFSFNIANPANDKAIIYISDNSSKNSKYTIKLCDKNGKVLYTEKTREKMVTIPISKYKSDTYIINITSDTNSKKYSKVLVIKQ